MHQKAMFATGEVKKKWNLHLQTKLMLWKIKQEIVYSILRKLQYHTVQYNNTVLYCNSAVAHLQHTVGQAGIVSALITRV